MKFKSLKIGTKLIIGFSAMLLFVIVLGVVSVRQSEQIHNQTELLYNHPYKVRLAISNLNNDIVKMRLATRDLMLSKNKIERDTSITNINDARADAHLQFDVLYKLYLGPKKDLDESYKAFMVWENAREENTKLALAGNVEEVKAKVLPASYVGVCRKNMLDKIEVLEKFAEVKGDTVYANSNLLLDALNQQTILIILIILVLSFFIIYFLLRSIKNPIEILTKVTKNFQEGNLDARSSITTRNEFGTLSVSFNSLAEKVQLNTIVSEKVNNLANIMMSEEDARRFFQVTLKELSNITNSQIAAVYLLSDNKKQFEYFESVGLSENAIKTFTIKGLEGEFGSVLASKRIQFIKRIPLDTRFVFQTVSGSIVPREIISIPVLVNYEVVAIISLASVRSYTQETIQLVEKMWDTLSARVEGVLAYKKMKTFTEMLEFQNRELEAQKTELASQSAELSEQNRELEIQKYQLNEANKLKTNFLSNMSHELRTPLNSVIALSGVLNRRLVNKIPQEEYSYLEVIERNGKNLLVLINDILDISRIESGRVEIELTTFNVNNLIAEIVEMLKPQADQKKIELIHSNTEPNLNITADSTKCNHILQNLIGNAIKFTEKGKVEVGAKFKDRKIMINITDTGIGISENNLEHIFDEFRQADSSTSRKYGGTGLGLSIAKKYANLLGGTIEVISSAGSGSTFTLILPIEFNEGFKYVQPAENKAIEIEPKIEFNIQESKYLNNTKTVLLVEDSEPAIIQIKDFIEECGYNIMVAHNGKEAFEKISEKVPDAMILDLMMPEVDGFEVLKNLRESEYTAHIPVLILTAKHITKEEHAVLKQSNVHQLIQKGDVNRNDLLTAVKTMMLLNKQTPENPLVSVDKNNDKPIVLIVEDNHDNMLTVKAIMDKTYTVLTAVDGIAGINMATLSKPNLILMDIALPGIDGVETFDKIKEKSELAHIPVIALTASAKISEREALIQHGFKAFIPKPIDEKLFFKTINEVLNGK